MYVPESHIGLLCDYLTDVTDNLVSVDFVLVVDLRYKNEILCA